MSSGVTREIKVIEFKNYKPEAALGKKAANTDENGTASSQRKTTKNAAEIQ